MCHLHVNFHKGNTWQQDDDEPSSSSSFTVKKKQANDENLTIKGLQITTLIVELEMKVIICWHFFHIL